MGKQHNRKKARTHTQASHRRSTFISRDVVKPTEKISIMPRGINTVTGPVLEYLENHRGAQVTLTELKNATGCNDNQIRASISYMRGKRFAIDTVVTGQCWVYRAAPPPPVAQETETPKESGTTTDRLTIPSPNIEEAERPKPAPPAIIMPKKLDSNEYLRVVDRSEERLILIDARGKVYKAVEI